MSEFPSDTVTADCANDPGGRITLDQSGPIEKRMSPNETTILRPIRDLGYSRERLDPHCVTALSVSVVGGKEDGEYRIERRDDGNFELTLAETASPGAILHLSAMYGPNKVQDVISVYDLQTYPLWGVWSQSGEGQGCESSHIRELDFGRSGFSVTWRPFETYKDFWGEYSIVTEDGDPSTAELTLNVTGGNYMPWGEGTRTLRVNFTATELFVVEGDFGRSHSGAVCTAPFQRLR